MKESITKFDLEAAFKALDELDTPVPKKGLKANRPALTEIFSRKTKFDALLEDYYDIGNTAELDTARASREAEVAQAKLARIEKIVDLNAESPEDLLPSYVGKFIMQCPQCMTLFYKDPEDIEASEEDPNTVNVNEVCQHCGNESGYTLVGKVGAATQEEQDDLNGVQELDVDSAEMSSQEFDEPFEEVPSDGDIEELEVPEDEEDIDFDLDIEEDEEEEEKTEESFTSHSGEVLMEDLAEILTEDSDTGVSASEFAELINSSEFKKPVSPGEIDAILANGDASGLVESLSEYDMSIEGFDYEVIDTFEDDGYRGHTVCYSKDGYDIVTIELWEDDSPITVIEDHSAPNLFDNVYDSFDSFAGDLEYKTSKYLKKKLTEAYIDTTYDEDDYLSPRIDAVMHYGKFLYARWVKDAPTVKVLDDSTFKVTHNRGGADVIVKFDKSNVQDQTLKFTVNGKSFSTDDETEAQNFILRELDNTRIKNFDVPVDEALNEGGLGTLAKTIGKKLAQTGKAIKTNISDAIDKFADKAKTRDEKADWVLTNARERYDKVEVDSNGQPMQANAEDRRFGTFVVLGFKETYSNGKPITMPPSFNNKDLVFGMTKPELTDSYKKADDIAKGWSVRTGNGPAFIYMAKDLDDAKAAFLCSYFKGELKQDQLEKYFETVKKDLEGAELMDKAGADQSPETADTDDSSDTTKPQDDATTTTTDESKEKPTETSDEQKWAAEWAKDLDKKLADDDGATKQESLDKVFANIDNLQEATLEKLITNSLIESYKNVAGFKITDCSYASGKFDINGIALFTSGNTKKITYPITEALVKDNKIILAGKNKNINNSAFSIIGHANSKDKTFIAESFKPIKK